MDCCITVFVHNGCSRSLNCSISGLHSDSKEIRFWPDEGRPLLDLILPYLDPNYGRFRAIQRLKSLPWEFRFHTHPWADRLPGMPTQARMFLRGIARSSVLQLRIPKFPKGSSAPIFLGCGPEHGSF